MSRSIRPQVGSPRQITEAFPWDTAPRYLLRDRDASYGERFQKRARAMGITEVVTAPRSPWQNAYVERVIGSIRRECLDHILVINERHLRRVLFSYVDYYHRSRTHLSLDKYCPDARPIQPPNCGEVIAIAQVGGLHQRYERLAACPAFEGCAICNAHAVRGEPCHRVQNPHGEYRLHGLTLPIGGSARAFHPTLPAAAQNLTPDGVLRRHRLQSRARHAPPDRHRHAARAAGAPGRTARCAHPPAPTAAPAPAGGGGSIARRPSWPRFWCSWALPDAGWSRFPHGTHSSRLCAGFRYQAPPSALPSRRPLTPRAAKQRIVACRAD